MSDIKHALKQAITFLNNTSPSAQLDAEILLAYVLNASRTFLYTHPEHPLDHTQHEAFQQLITKRCEGLPIAYLTNSREFWSLPLRVCKDTLIPRPETELLVELTLALLKDTSPASVIDLGTGSGAIALALASERPDWQIIACDANQAAVDTAYYNATNLGLTNVHICHSDWFASISQQQFSAVVSNPPYIAKDDPHLTEGDVRFEPKEALISGVDGLESLKYIIQASYDRLLPGGFLLLEHGYDQKQAVTSLLKARGYEQVHCWQDWQGHDRVSGGWRP
jgi:release factor glutamine methyltransferase